MERTKNVKTLVSVELRSSSTPPWKISIRRLFAGVQGTSVGWILFQLLRIFRQMNLTKTIFTLLINRPGLRARENGVDHACDVVSRAQPRLCVSVFLCVSRETRECCDIFLADLVERSFFRVECV
jgi:hypothetical protein